MILGIGIDVCDIARLRRALSGPAGGRFRARVFTDAEQAYCEARQRGRFASYAARFAAKEAAMKALGTGWANGIGWRDIEVVRDGDDRPALALHGNAAALARRRGMARWLVALSHDGGAAVASVVVEGAPPVRGRGGSGAAARPRGAGAGAGRRRSRDRR
jgi:holo-[acyl-carrier protein] synthase